MLRYFNKKCIVFLTSFPVIKERNKNRKNKVLDNDVLLMMMKRFQIPLNSEFGKIEYIF